MQRLAWVIICCATASVAIAAGDQTADAGWTGTNQVNSGATTTNIIGIVFEQQTNIVLRLSPFDGTRTNAHVRIRRTNIYPDEIIVVPKLRPLGDFWLRGEFEKLLEQKRLERKQKKE